MKNWREIIRFILFKKDIDQKELAVRLGCSRGYVSNIFTGREKPSKRAEKALNEMHEECK